MQNITQKARAYKRGVINQFKPFFMSGQLTAQELEFIANGAMTDFYKETK